MVLLKILGRFWGDFSRRNPKMIHAGIFVKVFSIFLGEIRQFALIFQAHSVRLGLVNLPRHRTERELFYFRSF